MNPFDWFTNLGQVVSQWYQDTVIVILKLLLASTVPDPRSISSNFFSLALGGTFGFAVKIFVLVAVVVTVMILLTPQRPHGAKIGAVLLSAFSILIFDYAFFPLYSLLFNLSQGLTKGVINVAVGSSDGTVSQVNALFSSAVPGSTGAVFFSSGLAFIFSFFTLIETVALEVALLSVLLLYPILIAIRPLGSIPRVLFNGANSAIVVVFISPPLMAIGFALPLLVRNIIPGGSLPGVTPVLTIVGGLGAMIVPAWLGYFFFKKSSQIFGTIDSTMRGGIDVKSLPPVSLDEAHRNIDAVRVSPFIATATDVIGDGIQHGDLFSDMKGTIINTVATATAAAGHPYVGMVIKGGDAALTKIRGSKSEPDSPPNEGGGQNSSA